MLFMLGIPDLDGQKNKTMGKQENRGVYRRGGSHTDGFHLSKSHVPQYSRKNTQRHCHGELALANTIRFLF